MLDNIPTRIARVRSSGFEVELPLMGPEGFAVDAIICPRGIADPLHQQAH